VNSQDIHHTRLAAATAFTLVLDMIHSFEIQAAFFALSHRRAPGAVAADCLHPIVLLTFSLRLRLCACLPPRTCTRPRLTNNGPQQGGGNTTSHWIGGTPGAFSDTSACATNVTDTTTVDQLEAQLQGCVNVEGDQLGETDLQLVCIHQNGTSHSGTELARTISCESGRWVTVAVQAEIPYTPGDDLSIDIQNENEYVLMQQRGAALRQLHWQECG
jgi:hypothetical protein